MGFSGRIFLSQFYVQFLEHNSLIPKFQVVCNPLNVINVAKEQNYLFKTAL